MRSIAVYCGSNFGRGDRYLKAAEALGQTLAAQSVRLIYGGATKGLMGVVADATLRAGGEVHGVITENLLARGQLHEGLTSHEVTPDMRSRKARMAEQAQGFVALPGGIGTLEELFEIWVEGQLCPPARPIGLLDVGGFYGPFLRMVDHMIAERFLPEGHRGMVMVHTDPAGLMTAMRAYTPVVVEKWGLHSA